jgi:hypothetical protein
MKNQYWIKQAKIGNCFPPWTCGNPPVFQAIRYYYVTFLSETIYPQSYGKVL